MDSDVAFAALLQRVRNADVAACRELVETCGNEIRRIIRVRLREPLLRSMVDTADIYQSVLMDFFTRMKLGQYEFDSPKDLVNLLLTMARHKLLNHSRHARVRRLLPQERDNDRPGPLDLLADSGESPSQVVLGEELLRKAHEMLSPEERQLANYRKEGRDWKRIGELIGDSPEAVRKRLMRAIDRVCAAFQLNREGV